MHNNHALPPAQPADAPAPQLYSSPLDRLLQSAVERTVDPAVKQWLLEMLNTGERAESSQADAAARLAAD